MSNPFYAEDRWVPYPGEDLTCSQCTSTNTVRVKAHPERRVTIDMLRCQDCGFEIERWEHQRKEPA